MERLRVIDSHTGGEPTRVVLEGQIPLQGDTMAALRDDFRARFDHLRSGLANEPRGSEVWVGAALTPPVSEEAVAGMVFFNNVGYLGMCGHGTIGIVETLRYLGRVTPGPVALDTPVGTVTAVLSESGEVTLTNVVSRRHLSDVTVEVGGLGTVRGDVGYGGNWFYIVHEPHFEITLSNQAELTDVCWRIRHALVAAGITGEGGEEIDHVELFGAEAPQGADSINFVQCPGGAYDRSPCGTGTSAKLACLHAAGKLAAGEEYRQMSVTGSVFRGSVQPVEGGVVPTIVGRASVIAESTLLFSEDDPIRWGLAS
ncbi:hydroxyproline-2-epimerase [bacterium]|nr:MAG: hydroxyproline-2-epimerase [bacterium]